MRNHWVDIDAERLERYETMFRGHGVGRGQLGRGAYYSNLCRQKIC